jgi:phosphotriesterase-related protein
VTGASDGSDTPVPTYRGPVPAGRLGWTLTHEHVFVLAPELDREYPHPEWDPEAAVEAAVSGLEGLWEQGVRTLVDLTVPGLGRDTRLVARVAARTRVNIVASTGWYADAVLPPFFRTHGPGRLVGGPEPLVEMFHRDVTDGIGDSGVRAGMLKVVTDEPGLTPDVVRVLEAAAVVHGRTQVPITTHSHPASRNGIDQARFLLDRGVDPARLVIGHSGDSDELDYLLQLLDLGVTLGMDRFGMAHTGDDDKRLGIVEELLARGFAAQLVLSHDSAWFSRMTPPSWRRVHAPEWSPDHLGRRIVPRLLGDGVSSEDVDTMLVANAARLLGGAVAA